MKDDGPGKYARFQKFDKKSYTEVNDVLKAKTHLTAREWAVARLCADFKEDGHSRMTWIGENLPELVPFMNEPYERQDVASAEAAFKRKVRRSGATFFYAYYEGLITMEEMLDMIHGVVEDITSLRRAEGLDTEGVSEEVQQMMAETLRRITDKLKEKPADDTWEE